MGRIEHQFETMLVGDRLQFADRRTAPPQVNADDAGSARRDHAAHGGGIEVVGSRINVRKHRRDGLPVQCMSSGDEGVGRDDHFAFQPQRADRDLQRDGAVAHRHTVFDAVKFGDAPLEFLHQRAVVAQPAPFKYIVHIFQERLAAADVGAAYVQLLVESRWCAVDGEVLRIKDGLHVKGGSVNPKYH